MGHRHHTERWLSKQRWWWWVIISEVKIIWVKTWEAAQNPTHSVEDANKVHRKLWWSMTGSWTHIAWTCAGFIKEQHELFSVIDCPSIMHFSLTDRAVRLPERNDQKGPPESVLCRSSYFFYAAIRLTAHPALFLLIVSPEVLCRPPVWRLFDGVATSSKGNTSEPDVQQGKCHENKRSCRYKSRHVPNVLKTCRAGSAVWWKTCSHPWSTCTAVTLHWYLYIYLFYSSLSVFFFFFFCN